MKRFGAVLALLLGACASMPITPAELRGAPDDPDAHAYALALWEDAVDLANAFLASEARATLPDGRFTLADDGMRFATPERVWPMRVRRTMWGGLTVWAGFAAQERSDGFVVGRAGDGPPLVANSFFRDPGLHWKNEEHLAALILHETTHVVFEEGTIGFWNSVSFYLVVLFTWRTTTHPDEELPNRTSAEFWEWRLNGAGKNLSAASAPRRRAA